jgi:hypothetical protein
MEEPRGRGSQYSQTYLNDKLVPGLVKGLKEQISTINRFGIRKGSDKLGY